jgi:antitoxin component of MazEF toxin-antitoxin module
MSAIQQWNRSMAVLLPSEVTPMVRLYFGQDLVIDTRKIRKLTAHPNRRE